MLPEELPVVFIISEHLKRIAQFTQINEAKQKTFRSMHVAINGNHPLAKKILTTSDQAVQKALAEQTYHLALLAQGLLEGASLAAFIKGYTDSLLNT